MSERGRKRKGGGEGEREGERERETDRQTDRQTDRGEVVNLLYRYPECCWLLKVVCAVLLTSNFIKFKQKAIDLCCSLDF